MLFNICSGLELVITECPSIIMGVPVREIFQEICTKAYHAVGHNIDWPYILEAEMSLLIVTGGGRNSFVGGIRALI